MVEGGGNKSDRLVLPGEHDVGLSRELALQAAVLEVPAGQITSLEIQRELPEAIRVASSDLRADNSVLNGEIPMSSVEHTTASQTGEIVFDVEIADAVQQVQSATRGSRRSLDSHEFEPRHGDLVSSAKIIERDEVANQVAEINGGRLIRESVERQDKVTWDKRVGRSEILTVPTVDAVTVDIVVDAVCIRVDIAG